jgi:hypothetical protein
MKTTFPCVRTFVAIATLAACALAPGVAAAQAPAQAQPPAQTDAALRQELDQLRKEFDALKERYSSQLTALEEKLAALQAAGAAPPAPAAAAPPPAPPIDPNVGQLGTTPLSAAAASNVFNPSTSVIGNFAGFTGRNEVNPQPALQMRESEVSFQAVVDPYARADFFMSFGEEGVDLEEGFITFPTLPGGLLMKVGKQKAAFGKVNTLHSHVLPWVDVPLVNENLLGGDEGIADAGLSVARLIPNPWIFLEATGQVYRGDAGDVFQSTKRGNLSYVTHLRAYGDINESTNIDLGASYAFGHHAPDIVTDVSEEHPSAHLYSIDATLRWKPLRRAIYNSFLGRSELVWSRREQLDGLARAFGFYVAGDYQFARRWFAGARYDLSDRADDASLRDKGHSLLLTYKPTEFSLVRGQYRRTNYAGREHANEFLFQFLFAIGAHGAHPF